MKLFIYGSGVLGSYLAHEFCKDNDVSLIARDNRYDDFIGHDLVIEQVRQKRKTNELIEKYPEKKELFDGYMRSQQDEYMDIESQSSLANVTWILKKAVKPE